MVSSSDRNRSFAMDGRWFLAQTERRSFAMDGRWFLAQTERRLFAMYGRWFLAQTEIVHLSWMVDGF